MRFTARESPAAAPLRTRTFLVLLHFCLYVSVHHSVSLQVDKVADRCVREVGSTAPLPVSRLRSFVHPLGTAVTRRISVAFPAKIPAELTRHTTPTHLPVPRSLNLGGRRTSPLVYPETVDSARSHGLCGDVSSGGPECWEGGDCPSQVHARPLHSTQLAPYERRFRRLLLSCWV